MESLPKISVISPSFNCVNLVARCIESVLGQHYENFEHIIVDGASTDGTLDVIKLYPHVRWVSEPDSGEAEALNKALRLATGDIINWLNVDDCYFGSEVLHTVAREAAAHPEADIFYGDSLQVDDVDSFGLHRAPMVPLDLNGVMRWFYDLNTFQPAIFYRAPCMRETGFFREDFNFAIDYEYMLRTCSKGFKYHYIDKVLAKATIFRAGAKSAASFEDQHYAWYENCQVYQQYLSEAERVFYWRDFYRFRFLYAGRYRRVIELPTELFEIKGFLIAILESGQTETAIESIKQYLQHAPELPELYWALSELSNKLPKPNDGPQFFKKGCDLALAQKR